MLGWIGSLRRKPPARPAAPTAAVAQATLSQGNAGPSQVSLTPAGGGLGAARSWGRSQARDSDAAAANTGAADTPDASDAPSALSWLLAAPPVQLLPPSAQEQALLQRLDGALAAPQQAGDLLPRAAGVLPQLMALMRQPVPSRTAMVRQLTKDPLLTAEVMRLARSPYYGAQQVATIESALDRIGTTGLQSAAARVLLKPIYQPQGDGLAARVASRVWQRTERKALCCADRLARQGGDRFEGFLVGMLHDSGWLALLRLIDRSGQSLQLPLSQAMDASLDRHKDRLFAHLLAGWELSPALLDLAAELQRAPLAQGDLPLARALWAADRFGAEAAG